jgi:uncharacterized protein
VRQLLVATVLCVMFAWAAMAQQSPQSPVNEINRANEGTVGVIAGMEGGTYTRTAADLTILDSDTLRVLPTLGRGSLQNLSDILYLKGIDIGFVQADALTYAKQHDLFPGLTENIRYIAKLYDEEVHILARKDINQIEDLNGQRVNVDVNGSGSAMTADILLAALGIKASIEHAKQVDGLQALKHGDIAAIIQVAGAPMSLLADAPSNIGLHFLPVTLNQQLAQTYLPAELTHDTYPSLVPTGQSVPTIAVGDVMAVFAWQPHSARYDRVSRFVDTFFSRFDEFLQPPRHPKWREVNLTAEVPGWIRFQPAHDWLMQRLAAGTASATTQGQFDLFLSQTHPSASAQLAESAKETLFRQFLQWSSQHATAR